VVRVPLVVVDDVGSTDDGLTVHVDETVAEIHEEGRVGEKVIPQLGRGERVRRGDLREARSESVDRCAAVHPLAHVVGRSCRGAVRAEQEPDRGDNSAQRHPRTSHGPHLSVDL